MLTQDEFTDYKADYSVYAKTSSEDSYGNAQFTYSETATATIHVMWNPVTDEAAIAEYGERVRKMKQCVLYGDAAISEHDRVVIGDVPYTIVSIMPYNTHRLVRVERS